MADKTKMKYNFLQKLILFIIATLPFSLERKIGGAWVTSSDILIAVAVAIWLVKSIFFEKDVRGKHYPLIIPLSGLLATFCISILVAISPWDTTRETCKYLLLFGFFYLLVNELNDEKLIKTVPDVIFVSSLVLGVWFIIHFIFHPFLPADKGWARGPFSQLHLNHLGTFLALTIPLSFLKLFGTDINRHKALIILAVLLQMTALIFTYSRLNWMVAAAVIIVILWNKYKMKGILYGFLMVTVPFTIISMVQPQYGLKDRLMSTFQRGDYSLMDRKRSSNFATSLILEKPVIGVGLGNFRDIAREKYNIYMNELVHNIYLQFWVEAGIFAMLFLIYVIIAYYHYVRSTLSLLGTHALSSLLLYSMLSFTSFILSTQFADPFVRGLKEYFALLLALPFAIRHMLTNENTGGAASIQQRTPYEQR